MKKALSVILSVLVIFSMLGMVAAAEDQAVTDDGLVLVRFVVYENDGTEKIVSQLRIAPGVNFVDLITNGEAAVGIPTKKSTETTEYVFKYWLKNGVDGAIEYTGNIPAVTQEEYDAGVRQIDYVAEFAEQEIKQNQSFFAFIESIFARINQLFEYFAKVFEGVIQF